MLSSFFAYAFCIISVFSFYRFYLSLRQEGTSSRTIYMIMNSQIALVSPLEILGFRCFNYVNDLNELFVWFHSISVPCNLRLTFNVQVVRPIRFMFSRIICWPLSLSRRGLYISIIIFLVLVRYVCLFTLASNTVENKQQKSEKWKPKTHLKIDRKSRWKLISQFLVFTIFKQFSIIVGGRWMICAN